MIKERSGSRTSLEVPSDILPGGRRRRDKRVRDAHVREQKEQYEQGTTPDEEQQQQITPYVSGLGSVERVLHQHHALRTTPVGESSGLCTDIAALDQPLTPDQSAEGAEVVGGAEGLSDRQNITPDEEKEPVANAQDILAKAHAMRIYLRLLKQPLSLVGKKDSLKKKLGNLLAHPDICLVPAIHRLERHVALYQRSRQSSSADIINQNAADIQQLLNDIVQQSRDNDMPLEIVNWNDEDATLSQLLHIAQGIVHSGWYQEGLGRGQLENLIRIGTQVEREHSVRVDDAPLVEVDGLSGATTVIQLDEGVLSRVRQSLCGKIREQLSRIAIAEKHNNPYVVISQRVSTERVDVSASPEQTIQADLQISQAVLSYTEARVQALPAGYQQRDNLESMRDQYSRVHNQLNAMDATAGTDAYAKARTAMITQQEQVVDALMQVDGIHAQAQSIKQTYNAILGGSPSRVDIMDQIRGLYRQAIVDVQTHNGDMGAIDILRGHLADLQSHLTDLNSRLDATRKAQGAVDHTQKVALVKAVYNIAKMASGTNPWGVMARILLEHGVLHTLNDGLDQRKQAYLEGVRNSADVQGILENLQKYFGATPLERSKMEVQSLIDRAIALRKRLSVWHEGRGYPNEVAVLGRQIPLYRLREFLENNADIGAVSFVKTFLQTRLHYPPDINTLTGQINLLESAMQKNQSVDDIEARMGYLADLMDKIEPGSSGRQASSSPPPSSP